MGRKRPGQKLLPNCCGARWEAHSGKVIQQLFMCEFGMGVKRNVVGGRLVRAQAKKISLVEDALGGVALGLLFHVVGQNLELCWGVTAPG